MAKLTTLCNDRPIDSSHHPSIEREWATTLVGLCLLVQVGGLATMIQSSIQVELLMSTFTIMQVDLDSFSWSLMMS